MQLYSWLSCLLFAAAVLAVEPPADLVIDTTYLPEGCTTKAQKGDSIQVHYVSSVIHKTSRFWDDVYFADWHPI